MIFKKFGVLEFMNAETGVSNSNAHHEKITISAGSLSLDGELVIPPLAAAGLIIFAHGSGSSRFSQRNQHVAQMLQEAGLATLLFNLLTEDEEILDATTRHLRFDINLLADRLRQASKAMSQNEQARNLKVAFFGASTGGAAALVAAAALGARVAAVVSRGGRPDLAGTALSSVLAPTLLIVGGRDEAVMDLNREAYQKLRCEKQLKIIPGATHLFEEPGTLDQVARESTEWFVSHF